MPNQYCLEIKGEFACFTRPEMKVERVSYDVITPSAARAVFEAVFWKPAIRWCVTKIEVLNPIQWISVRRNEVGKIFTGPTAKHLHAEPCETMGFFVEDQRQQRASLLLRDVKYRIFADLIFDNAKDPESTYGKFTSMFERRVERGQCFNQPYLGCREFSCSFRLVNDAAGRVAPISETRELGWMLYDMDFSVNEGRPTPRFFQATLKDGVVLIPPWDSPEVRG